MLDSKAGLPKLSSTTAGTSPAIEESRRFRGERPLPTGFRNFNIFKKIGRDFSEVSRDRVAVLKGLAFSLPFCPDDGQAGRDRR